MRSQRAISSFKTTTKRRTEFGEIERKLTDTYRRIDGSKWIHIEYIIIIVVINIMLTILIRKFLFSISISHCYSLNKLFTDSVVNPYISQIVGVCVCVYGGAARISAYRGFLCCYNVETTDSCKQNDAVTGKGYLIKKS